MLALLKLVKSLVQTLHSNGSPSEIAAGVMLGACLGITPLTSAHNIVILALLCVLNVSFGAGMLGWALFVPVGFLLDPVFDRIGALLLGARALVPLWTALDATPLLPYTNFNNTVTLGSLVAWLVSSPAIFFASHLGIRHYRARFAQRIERWRVMQAIKASKAYDVYQWFAG